MRSRSLPFLALACAAVTAPVVARAQTVQPVDGVLWMPETAIDPDTVPHVESTRAPGHLNWNAGLAVDVLARPYAYRTPATTMNPRGTVGGLVDAQVWSHLNLQLGLLDNLAIAVDIPVLTYQSANFGPLGQPNPETVGFGDVRYVLRWSSHPGVAAHGRDVARNGPANNRPADSGGNDGFGLSFLLAGTVPTGDSRSLAGYGAATLHPTLVGDVRALKLVIAVSVGYRFRFDQYWASQSGDCSNPASTMPGVSCLAQVPLRDAITWSIGIRAPQWLFQNLAAPYVEAYGQFDARHFGAAGTSPVEIGGGLQRQFSHEQFTANLEVTGGASNAPGVPIVRTMLSLTWAPRFIDDDNDGLRDDNGEDRCVGLPEDLDGYMDNDGCPEDNDHDEVPDLEDRCPMVDEDPDGYQDEDGCPDPDNDSDGVLDVNDLCPNAPMGPHPDESRPGCPDDDIDGDGVPNDRDQCVDTPQGDTPDPTRPGCTQPDGDHDGVSDAQDACPTEPAGANASSSQRGCPENDRDHDGVPDAQDHCPDQPETINGVDDADGCPESAPPRNARPAVVLAPGEAGTARGEIELTIPVRFGADDRPVATSALVIAQLAQTIAAHARRPWRHYEITVAMTAANVRGPAAVDAARATRRRDALIAALREHGAPEWAVRPAAPAAAPARAPARDPGVVIRVVNEPASSGNEAPPAPPAGAHP